MSVARSELDAALGIRLTDEQWAVVSSPLAPAVVIAGAGTGKTTSMAARVAWLVASGLVPADSVLGLTFTNKAAGGLLSAVRKGIRDLGAAGFEIAAGDGQEDWAEPTVSTYHAFASAVLAAHGIRLGLESGLPVLADGAREQLAYRFACSSTLPLGATGKSPEDVTKSLLRLDDQLAELDIAPEVLQAHDEAMVRRLDAFDSLQANGVKLRDTADGRAVLAQLVAEWRQAKLDRDVVDYADQVRLALALVRAFPEVGQSLRDRYHVVLLDEYQDTSIAQRHLLQEVFGDGHPVTAVGDPCQAIFGWRGASVDNITNFTRHFAVGDAPAARYQLTVNRRSGPQILAAANEAASPLRSRHPEVDPLRTPDAVAVDASRVVCALFDTAPQERTWVADRIAELGPHAEWGDIAVIASTGAELAAVDELLRARGVPTQISGLSGLLQQPAVVELRALLECVHDPVANPWTLRVLSGARWRIGVRDLAALGRRAGELAGRQRRVEADDVLAALEGAVAGSDPADEASLSDAVLDPGDPSAYSPDAVLRFAELGGWIRTLRRHAGGSPAELLRRALELSGLDIAIATGEPGWAEQQEYAVTTFLELAERFHDVEGEVGLGAFLVRLDDAERFDADLPMELAARADAVQLLTVHRAKGLEFPHVFVPGMAKEAFPGGPAREQWPASISTVPWALREDSTPDLESFPPVDEPPKDKQSKAYAEVLKDVERAETERLAYVAFTRAMRTLVVTGHWWGPTQKTKRGPNAFLEAVCEACRDGAGEVAHWAEDPGDERPDRQEREFAWPAALPSARVAAIREAAASVRAAMGSAVLPGMEGSKGTTPPEAASWDAEIEALLSERRAAARIDRVVPLPDRLSASTALRAIAEPEALAQDLVRPMPRPSAPAARRGTAFHAWVQARYGQQSLLDPDDLPGAADDGIASDADLERLKEAFAKTEYADLVPVAVETPFSLAMGGRLVNGRIDAVFERDGRFEVVDWKTGRTTDDLQLAIYVMAWAQRANVPVEDIDAAFVLVRTGEVVRPDLGDAIARIRSLLESAAIVGQVGAGDDHRAG